MEKRERERLRETKRDIEFRINIMRLVFVMFLRHWCLHNIIMAATL